MPSKAWWGETAGAYSSIAGERPDIGRVSHGWKVTAMEMGWDTLQRMGEKITQLPPIGEGEVDVSPLHLNRSEQKSMESKFLRAQVDPRSPSGDKTS